MSEGKGGSELRYALVCLFAAFIWGSAFVAQSIGAESVGPLTFTASRNWIGAAALLPVVLWRRKRAEAEGKEALAKWPSKRKVIQGGLICGLCLLGGSTLQQAGIAMTTTAKAGFITTLYVVLIPLFSIAIGKMPEKKVWLCVVLALTGLYLLSIKDGFTIGRGDILLLLCAVCFSFQMLAVALFVQVIDPVLLSMAEFLTVAIIATGPALFFERFDGTRFMTALPSILYAGILSSAVAFTLQIVAQTRLSPSVAALMMSMESVFAALCGWIILHQTLTPREFLGCAVMFSAVIISQVKFRKRQTAVPVERS